MARHVYTNSNIDNIKENIFSFTIKIDNNQSLIWDSVLSDHYGLPLDRKTNGKHWKHLNYSDDNSNTGDIIIGKWHIPKKDKQSKINIQSNINGNLLPAHFVTVHFPKLLEEVKAKAASNSQSLTVIANYSCSKCDHKTKTRQLLDNHMKKVHKRNPISTPQLNEASNKPAKFVIHPPMNVLPSTPTTLKCHICGSIFYKEEYLNEHLTTVHKGTLYPNPSLESTEDQIQNHPDKNIPCVLCGKTFTDPAAATKHIQNQHELQCDNCDHICYDKYDLNTHILSTHKSNLSEPEVPNHSDMERLVYTCMLEQYANTVDKQTATIECEPYDIPSPNKNDHETHAEVNHTELTCADCSYTTNTESHLTLHRNKEHPEKSLSQDQLVPCALCGITFTSKNDLENHIQRRHVTHQPSIVHNKPTHDQSHFQALILEEIVDMAQTLRLFKETTAAQLSDIRDTQEAFKQELQILSERNIQTNSDLSRNYDKLETNINHLSSEISSSITSLSSSSIVSSKSVSPSPISFSSQSVSRAPPTSSVASQTSSTPSCTPPVPTVIATPPAPPSSLEAPVTMPVTAPLFNNSCPSAPFPPPPPPAHTSTISKSVRLPTSKRHKVLFLADSIGSKADIRHLEEATNTLIYRERAYRAAYKEDASLSIVVVLVQSSH